MALQFRGFPQREQKPRDYSDILTPLAALGQGVQGYLNEGIRDRQTALQEAENARQGAAERRQQMLFERQYSPMGMPQSAATPGSYPQMADAGVADYQPLLTQPMPQKSGLISHWEQQYGPQMGQSRADYAEQLGYREKEQGFKKGEAEIDKLKAEAKLRNALAAQGGKPETLSPWGVDENGNMVLYGNKSGIPKVVQNPTGGNIYPKTIGTEEQRRQALVRGAKTSLQDIRSNLTPELLSELKAIRFTPGRVYSQLASPQAKNLYVNLREAIADEIYLKTGATANQTELENATISYMTALNDNPQDFISRLDLLERNISPFNPRGGIQNQSMGRITQRNKKTGQIRFSDDGGRTWQTQ